ncbi:MAG: PEP-CTERM sorting domain-containing protein [Rhizobacter sp.]|nr:PEP-CTERM sorting domain-containing protein [Rhizobacter sp.]
MLNRIRKPLRNAVMGAVVSLAGAGAAQATVVGGVFDPAFGAALKGVNFSGTVQFEISQNCLDPSWNLFVYATSTCNSHPSGELFDFAHVNFTGTQTGSLDFGSGALTVLGMYVQNHHVIGVQTSLSVPVTATGGLAGDQFEIIFGRTNLTAAEALQEPGPPTGPDGDSDLDDFPATDFQVTTLFLVNGPGCSLTAPCKSNPATTTYVPEPGSLSLALGSLGIAWLVRRKKPGALTAPTA